ncbi:MAG: hypothetical protein KC589_04520 [Nanoarchaeota archaeon]|nr:hypothetical protein [Nanoarchaeota archaeon]
MVKINPELLQDRVRVGEVVQLMENTVAINIQGHAVVNISYSKELFEQLRITKGLSSCCIF